MVSGLFSTLMQEVTKALNIPFTVKADQSCELTMPNKTTLIMEIDESDTNFRMYVELGVIPHGGYREQLFEEGLIYNGVPEPRAGTFGYSEVSDMMLFFKLMPLKNLTGQQIADAIGPLVEKASTWKEAISKGEHPPAESGTTLGGEGIASLMGLKP